VRAEGVSDEEIVEIIALAALGNYLDTLADALRVDVDDVFKAPA
jgi:alkylhydroperoxidase/carboxymuconolactone decarboxylase family protein YurZ